MNLPHPGRTTPGAGFDAPLAMLDACHERMRERLDLLRRLPAHLAAHGADEQARQAAASVLRYFDLAAPDHHADEEQDLFPALIDAMAGSDAVCLRELTAALTLEHRQLEACWQRLRIELQQLVDGRGRSLDEGELRTLLDLYTQHTTREDSELLPMAARLLDEAALRQLGSAMRLRRGIAAGA